GSSSRCGAEARPAAAAAACPRRRRPGPAWAAAARSTRRRPAPARRPAPRRAPQGSKRRSVRRSDALWLTWRFSVGGERPERGKSQITNLKLQTSRADFEHRRAIPTLGLLPDRRPGHFGGLAAIGAVDRHRAVVSGHGGGGLRLG